MPQRTQWEALFVKGFFLGPSLFPHEQMVFTSYSSEVSGELWDGVRVGAAIRSDKLQMEMMQDSCLSRSQRSV
jgi:hypothetical protein